MTRWLYVLWRRWLFDLVDRLLAPCDPPASFVGPRLGRAGRPSVSWCCSGIDRAIVRSPGAAGHCHAHHNIFDVRSEVSPERLEYGSTMYQKLS